MAKKLRRMSEEEKDRLLEASLQEIEKMPPESFGKGGILDPDEFDPKYCKVRITTFIDQDIYLELKRLADEQNTKYQTLLNNILRQGLCDTTAKQFQSQLKKLKANVKELEELGEKRFSRKCSRFEKT